MTDVDLRVTQLEAADEIISTALFGRLLKPHEKVIRDDGSERAREDGIVGRFAVVETDVRQIKDALANGIVLRLNWKAWGGLGTAIMILLGILLRLLGVDTPS